MGIAAGCRLLGAGTKVATRRLRVKAKKHDQIRVLVQSKLHSIADIVSKALEDGQISHDEFQLVVKEVQGYHTMKKEMRAGGQKKSLELDETTRRELIETGREAARHSFMQKIGAGSSRSN